MTAVTPGPDLRTRLGRLVLANPVMPASGCFGPELASLIDTTRLGATVTKTVFSGRRAGNRAHRLTDVGSTMLNSVGIPSPGTARFRREVLPAYRALGVPVVASIGGLTVQEYEDVAGELEGADMDAVEVNVSCPNLEHGSGLEIGSDPRHIETITHAVRQRLPGTPVIVKLTPNVTSIVEIARAAEAAGADAVTVANTFAGMVVDRRLRRPVLGNVVGGVSGPAVKPMVLRMVWQTATAVDVPVIACGGIGNVEDTVDFLVAGAAAVQIGTATFSRPDTTVNVVAELPACLTELGFGSVAEAVGSLETHHPDTVSELELVTNGSTR